MRQESPVMLDDDQKRYLGAAVFCSGAGALVLELSARLISPYYGSSLYTWSALITVTLVALPRATPSAAGRRTAPSLTLFARIIGLAGLFVAMVPTCAIGPAPERPLGAMGRLGRRVLVAPSLFLLGALGRWGPPQRSRWLGRAQGRRGLRPLDGGSVLGALGTGFPWSNLPLPAILYGLAAALLGPVGQRPGPVDQKIPVRGRRPPPRPLVGPYAPRRATVQSPVEQTVPPWAGQVLGRKSRTPLVDGTTQSVARLASPGEWESESSYLQSMEVVLLRPKARRALFIAGAGILPRS